MNFISKVLTTAVALPLTLSGFVSEAKAGQFAVDSYHQSLISTVRSTGISFQVNPPQCFKDDAPMGYYWAAKNEMVICQEMARSSWKETMWTAEDLDTLRHEAQHLVQDCMAGGRRDGRLGAVYTDPIGMAKSVLSSSTINWIINDGYKNESDHIKVMELEAFSVAALNDPREQVRDIHKYCF